MSNHGRPRELIQNGKRIRYTYDTHGRVLYKTTEALNNPETAPRTALQLQYNANNELAKSLRTEYQGNKIIKTLTEYHYDAFGRRIAKISETRNFILITSNQNKDQLRQTNKTQHQHSHMLWDGDLPIQEYSDTHVYTTIYDQGSFKPVARLAWLRDDLSEVANDERKNDKGWYGNDKPAAKTGIQVYHYHNDQLGTPNELTSQDGEVVWLADYQAWGETREEMCWGHILVSQGESCARVVEDDVWHEQQLNPLQVEKEHLQPIRFQGQHFDTETGLHYNRFRYYDPDMGMFTTRDPIGLRGGDNVFQYAPNPTGWVDPLGLRFTGYSMDDAHSSLRKDPNVSPATPIQWRANRQIGGYSKSQIYNRWLKMEAAFAEGKMEPCPVVKPNPGSCTSCSDSKWRKYGGDSTVFHCGFDGYLENRIPGENDNDAPTNECFYDRAGALVTKSHEYGGCRGTPDYYPFYNDGTEADNARAKWHGSVDSGGPFGPSESHINIGWESYSESKKYYKENPHLRPPTRLDLTLRDFQWQFKNWTRMPQDFSIY